MEDKEKSAALLNRLKEEITRRKETVDNIKELLKQEIDREYQENLWELSPRELDDRMGRHLTFLNDDSDTRPGPAIIASHRKIFGKPIVLIKRIIMKLAGFYTNSILEKQRRFNDQLVAFHLASFIRFKHNEAKLKEIEERIKDFEDDRELLLDELRSLRQHLQAAGKSGGKRSIEEDE